MKLILRLSKCSRRIVEEKLNSLQKRVLFLFGTTVSLVVVVDMYITDPLMDKCILYLHAAVENLVSCHDKYYHKCGTMPLLHNWKTELRLSQV